MRLVGLNRRKFLTAVTGGAVERPVALRALPRERLYRIGFLGAVAAGEYGNLLDTLRQGLRDLGYVEGKNIVIEYRWAAGKYDRLPELAAELVRLDVNVIVTHGTPGSVAAK